MITVHSMAAITYPIAVRSLADMFPDLSQISALESHRINEGKTAGDPFDRNAAYDMEQTVKELEPLTRKLNDGSLLLLACCLYTYLDWQVWSLSSHMSTLKRLKTECMYYVPFVRNCVSSHCGLTANILLIGCHYSFGSWQYSGEAGQDSKSAGCDSGNH